MQMNTEHSDTLKAMGNLDKNLLQFKKDLKGAWKMGKSKMAITLEEVTISHDERALYNKPLLKSKVQAINDTLLKFSKIITAASYFN